LSIISSANGIPLGIKLGAGNIHDIKLLIETLPKKTFFKVLYADKGYNSIKLKKRLLINRKIKLIYPYKKNQIDINTIEDSHGIKNRMRVEHVNNFLKQNKALNTRYEKDISNFESLVYLGCLKLGLQIIIREFYKF
jgi:transposase